MESPVGRSNTTEPSADQLGRYDAIIVVWPQQLRDETVGRLVEWKTGTRRLVLCGQTRAAQSGYARLCAAALRRQVPPRNSRHLCHTSRAGMRIPGRVMFGGQDRTGWAALRQAHPADVGIQLWQTGNRTLVHLINYGYDKDSDQVRDVENIEPRLSPPATFGLALLAG